MQTIALSLHTHGISAFITSMPHIGKTKHAYQMCIRDSLIDPDGKVMLRTVKAQKLAEQLKHLNYSKVRIPKTSGAFVSPKDSTKYSNKPYRVVNAVLGISSGLIRI